MNFVHFDLGNFTSNFEEGENGTIVKNALVLVEGTHKDNAGNVHDFSKNRVMQSALNTNEALHKGETIPFKANHSKDVRDDMGEICSLLECRLITHEDLPDKRHQHLLGKLGAFTKVEIKKNIDDVKKNIIKSLSPGIDTVKNRLVEVSAVSRPAILGMALFGSQGSLSFKQAKEQTEKSQKLKDTLQEDFNIFWNVLVNIFQTDELEMPQNNQQMLILEAINEYSEELKKQLEVDDYQQETIGSSNIYNDNPYGDILVRPNANNQQFSDEEDSIVNLVPKKRRKSKHAI